MSTCLACGYVRKQEDMAPDYECPRCGRVYGKVQDVVNRDKARKPWFRFLGKKNQFDPIWNSPGDTNSKQPVTTKYPMVRVAVMILGGLCILYFWGEYQRERAIQQVLTAELQARQEEAGRQQQMATSVASGSAEQSAQQPFIPSGRNTASTRPNTTNAQAIPAYRTVASKDLSFGATRRIQVRVSVPKHYPQDVIEQIARKVVSDVTQSQPVNAISIFFYGPGTATDGFFDVASVDWAPNGRWSDANTVRSGNYTSFRYKVSYNPPTPTARASSEMRPSSQTGLLGVPLPDGARLTSRTPGDAASDRDPSERYAVAASAAEIAAFFNKVMPGAGWTRDGMSRGDALFFRKGNLMIGVLINQSGGTFTLIGS